MASSDTNISASQYYISTDNQPSHRGSNFRFSNEELQILRECNRESFYTRSLPLAAVFGIGTHLAVKNGYLKSNARWGSGLKVTVASFIGYFVGKFSYQSRCMEKMMQLESSQIGEVLRKRKMMREGKVFDQEIAHQTEPDNQLPKVEGTYRDPDDHVSDLDVDVEKNMQPKGLDASQKPNLDSDFIYSPPEITDEKNITPFVSYDDLRKQNREPPLRKDTISTTKAPPQIESKQTPAFSPSSYSAKDEPKPKGTIKNKYGDVWEE